MGGQLPGSGLLPRRQNLQLRVDPCEGFAKKVDQCNVMKANVLANHFYCTDVVDIDESDDYSF